MPFNGSGTFTPATGNPVAPGTVIESNWANNTVTDIASGLTNAVTRDGQGKMTVQFGIINGNSSVPGIGFTSETSTGIYRPGTGIAAFVAQGVEVFRYNSNGRLILGSTSDDGANRLQVTGNSALTGTLAVSGNATVGGTLGITGMTTLADLTTTGNTILGNASTDTLNVGNGGLIKDASGNVGIGTAPGSVLHIYGSNAVTTIESPGVSSASLQFRTNATDRWRIGVPSATADLAFFSGSATERMRINNSGNVGIGVAPISAVPLLVHTASNRNVAVLDQSSTATITSVTDAGSSAPLRVVGNTLYFSGNGSADHMRLDASGNLGVGTTSPNARLHVSGVIGASTAMVNSTTLPTSGQRIGLFGFGVDGETVIGQARISAFAEGNWTTNTSSATYMTFNTTPSGSPTSVERMRIDASGNVGVGVAPSYKLHVSGTNYQVVATNGTNSNTLGASGGVSYVGSIDATPLLLQTGNAERMRIDTSGNVGIGATSAGARLHVSGGGEFTGTPPMNGTNASLQVGVLSAAITSTVDAFVGWGAATQPIVSSASSGNGSLLLAARNVVSASVVLATSNLPRLIVDSSGNVGIGAAPSNLLHLNAAAGVAVVRWSDTTNGNLGFIGSGNGVISTATNSMLSIRAETSLVFASGGNNERMRIDSSGNVGIGVTPSEILDVQRSTGSDIAARVKNTGAGRAVLKLDSGSGSTADVRFYENATQRWSIQSATGSNVLSLVDASAGERLRIDSSGNVGVGVTPTGGQGLLQVAGAIKSTQGLNVTGNGGFYNAANKFGLDVNSATTRLYASGSDASTRGAYEFHITDSVGSLDMVALRISNTGVISDTNSNELGYKGLPSASVTTGAFAASDKGKCVYATAGVTVPNSTMATGDVVTIVNTTGSAVTITASITTLRLAGTALTGNRTLAAYGIASIVFSSSTLGFISGNVS